VGCDIHTMAEVLVTPRKYDKKKQVFVDQPQKWKAVTRDIFTNPYYWPTQEIKPFGKYPSNVPYTHQPYRGRNYELFSLLADVRNHNPLANVFDTSMRYASRESLLPIAMPRGIPEDPSKEWAKYADDGDLHSHSFFTLTELLKAVEDGAFEQNFQNSGYVDVAAYRALKKNGTKPQGWSMWASNGISEEAYLALSPADQEAFTGTVSTTWPDDTVGSFDWFLTHTIPELTLLAPFAEPLDHEALRAGKPDTRARLTDNVRFVFAFDN
jgi:hypothetical protein